MLFTVFSLLELFFSCCKMPAIVLIADFQRIQMLRHQRLALDWLSVSFFVYWPIRMSGLLYFLALNEPSSALNYLKTAFILTNQNWVIFSCILLAHKTHAIVYAFPAVTWYHYFPYRSAAQKTEQHSITTSPDFPSNKKFNFPLYHKRNQEIFVQGRRLFNTLTSWNFHGILPPLSKENFKQK